MKRIKMLLYGEPGVGKSVFASKSPNPFFITTDDNYEWLEDFGAKSEAHLQVHSWEEAKKAFTQDYDNYDTIVIDLLEDMFKWCEQEFCKRSKLDHISDIGYGKGYDITRNEFFLEISKLLSKPKNIILITHGITFETKDRRGVTQTRYAPSSRIPDKVLDMIEGRLRYCLRCYLKAEETENGQLIKKRYLSLIPKENEFGICRGIDETVTPHDIPLDWNEFEKALNLDNTAEVINDAKDAVEYSMNVFRTAEPAFTPAKEIEKTVTENNPLPFDETTQHVDEVQETVKEEVKDTKPEPQAAKTETISQADKLAAIKAKLEALKANK